jgi:hypothetical protein
VFPEVVACSNVGERLCTTRIAFHPNCSFGDTRTLSRSADTWCQEFPDAIGSQIDDRTRAAIPAIPIRPVGHIIGNRLVTGRVPTVPLVAKQLAKGEEYVDA